MRDGWTGGVLEKIKIGRHPCIWYGKNQQFLSLYKNHFPDLVKLFIKNMLKRHENFRSVFVAPLFLVREFPPHLLIFPNPGGTLGTRNLLSRMDFFWALKDEGEMKLTMGLVVKSTPNRLCFQVTFLWRFMVYTPSWILSLICKKNPKAIRNWICCCNTCRRNYKSCVPQLQEVGVDMPEPWRGSLMSLQRVTSFL